MILIHINMEIKPIQCEYFLDFLDSEVISHSGDDDTIGAY